MFFSICWTTVYIQRKVVILWGGGLLSFKEFAQAQTEGILFMEIISQKISNYFQVKTHAKSNCAKEIQSWIYPHDRLLNTLFWCKAIYVENLSQICLKTLQQMGSYFWWPIAYVPTIEICGHISKVIEMWTLDGHELIFFIMSSTSW